MPGPPGDRPPPPGPQEAATPGGPWTRATDAVQGPGVEGAWHHHAVDARPTARGPPSRAWPCWGTALPAARLAVGPSRKPPRSAGDANLLMAQDKTLLDHAAPFSLVAVTCYQPPAYALEPARACSHPQPHRCRSLGHHDGPAPLRVPEPPPPAHPGSADGTDDRPTTAADRA